MEPTAKHTRARSQLHVDDPVISVCGTDEFCDDATATAVAIWKMTGFKLARAQSSTGRQPYLDRRPQPDFGRQGNREQPRGEAV